MPSFSVRERGQALVATIVLAGIAAGLMCGLFAVASAVHHKIVLQTATDNALLSALNVQANGLNAIAVGNRAILSNDALAAALNSRVSEAIFYRKLAEKFARIVRFIPEAGPFLSTALSKSGRALERLMEQAAAFMTPVTRTVNRLIGGQQNVIARSLPALSLKAGKEVFREGAPGANLSAPSYALLARQSVSLSRSIQDLPAQKARLLLTATLDRHTRSRSWRAKVAGFRLPVKKYGGTAVTGSDLVSSDKLKLPRLTWRGWKWKTALSSRSRASNFGYHGQSPIKTMGDDMPRQTVTFIAHRDMARSFAAARDRRIVAVASGELYFSGTTGPTEEPNLMNPGWRARLIPVADETNAARVTPGVALKEVLH